MAVFYGSKSSKSTTGESNIPETKWYVVVDGQTVVDGRYCDVGKSLEEYVPKMDLIIMDGCSMTFDLSGFSGTLVVAAPPSLFVKNLINAIIDHYMLTMPPLEDQEALDIGKMLGIKESVVKDNLSHMKGIACYLLESSLAKRKVKEAVEEVNTSCITKIVSMQSPNRAGNRVMVHALVLWKVGSGFMATPKFELVFHFAEKLVARKLVLETAARLKSARQDMAPLSGAEGYAGALFEAYAIRTIQEGGTFDMRSLDDEGTVVKTICIPPIKSDPIVVESNDLTKTVVPYGTVRVKAEKGQFSPRLLWPITTNFPMFDCLYFHTTGEAFPLQITSQ